MVTAFAGVLVQTPNGAAPPLPSPPATPAVPPLPPPPSAPPPAPAPPVATPPLPALEPPLPAVFVAPARPAPGAPAAVGTAPPPFWPAAATLPPRPAAGSGFAEPVPALPPLDLAGAPPSAAGSPQPASTTTAKTQPEWAPNAKALTPRTLSEAGPSRHKLTGLGVGAQQQEKPAPFGPFIRRCSYAALPFLHAHCIFRWQQSAARATEATPRPPAAARPVKVAARPRRRVVAWALPLQGQAR